MSADELDKFNEAIELVGKLAGLFKAAIASAFAVCAVVAGVAIWVNTTSATAEQTKKELHDLILEKNQAIRDWSEWRSTKDKIDTQLTIIVENQERHFEKLDRQSGH